MTFLSFGLPQKAFISLSLMRNILAVYRFLLFFLSVFFHHLKDVTYGVPSCMVSEECMVL